MARVTLTKADLETEAGQTLVALIDKIGADNDITLDEVSELLSAVGDRGPLSHISGAAYLNEIILQVIEDGKIEPYEFEKLRAAMARVLPKKKRDEFTRNFGPIADTRRPAGSWHFDPVTEKQIEFMIKLGVPVNPSMTKGEASELISDALERKESGVSERQMMILKFWNKLELSSLNRRQVSDWMDEWYAEDARRREAWERYKESVNGVENLDRIALGEGYRWLSELDQLPAVECPFAPNQIPIDKPKSVVRLPTFRPRPSAPAKPSGVFGKIIALFSGLKK